MRSWKRIGWAALFAGIAVTGRAQVWLERAENELIGLVELQRSLLERAAKADDQLDVEDLRPRLQTLVYDYEALLRHFPDYPEGYISYAMLLGNPLVDERERAMALLLKANELNPNQAIVKNQLGKYIAEEGKPLVAVNYFLSAIELAPNEPLYHFQLGQLLGSARRDFVSNGAWQPAAVDAAMMHAFEEAVRLAPDNLAYAYRRAEAFYDLGTPRWDDALAAWRELEAHVTAPRDRQVMKLHQANVLISQHEFEAAKTLMAAVRDEGLDHQKDRLFERIARLMRDPTAEDPRPESVAASASGASPSTRPSGPALPQFDATLGTVPADESLLGVSIATAADGDVAAAFDSADEVFSPSLRGLAVPELRVEPEPTAENDDDGATANPGES